MNTVKKFVFLPVLALLILSGCDSVSSSGNHAPEISEILASPPFLQLSRFYPESGIILTAVATDADNDSISYFWSASAGSYSDYSDYSTTSNPANWVPDWEADPGSVTITCTVSDGVKTDTMSITIDVTE